MFGCGWLDGSGWVFSGGEWKCAMSAARFCIALDTFTATMFECLLLRCLSMVLWIAIGA